MFDIHTGLWFLLQIVVFGILLLLLLSSTPFATVSEHQNVRTNEHAPLSAPYFRAHLILVKST
jgi:hypothetical protein